jgi:hypothetical protein
VTNIDHYLIEAREDAGNWAAETATSVARGLIGHHDATIDWDEGAGESWIRLVVGGAVVAYVSAVLPLAIVERRLALAGRHDPRVELIEVEGVGNPELCCSDAALRTAFGDSRRFELLNNEQFSADDLWYATV